MYILVPFKDKIGMHTPVLRSNNIFPVYKLNEKFLQMNDKKSKFFIKVSLHKNRNSFPRNLLEENIRK